MKIYLMVLWSYIEEIYSAGKSFVVKYDRQITDIVGAAMVALGIIDAYYGSPWQQITIKIVLGVYGFYHGRGAKHEVSE